VYALNIITLIATTLALVIMGGGVYFVSRRVTRARLSGQFDMGRVGAESGDVPVAAVASGE
jgi:hypothetical protein